MRNITTKTLKNNIYRLKREYGFPLEVYRHLGQVLDIETGTHVYNREKINVRRGIVLPGNQHRDVLHSPTIASGTLGFAYGGDFEITDRVFILDSKDLPSNFLLTLQDYIIWEDKRYDFRLLSQLEQKTGYYVVGKEVKGSLRYAIIDKKLETITQIGEIYTQDILPTNVVLQDTEEESLFNYNVYYNSLLMDETEEETDFTYNWSYLEGIQDSAVVESVFDYTRRFMPHHLSNMTLWLRVHEGAWKDINRIQPAITQSDPIAALTDFSPNEKHAIQASSASRPLLQTGANGINNRRTVRFDGVDDWLASINTFSGYTPEIFIVFKINTLDAQDIMFSDLSNGYFLGTYVSFGGLRLIRSAGTTITTVNGFTNSTNYMLRVYFARGQGANAAKLKLSGQSEQSFTIDHGDYAAGSLHNIDIGRFNAAGHYQGCDIAEVIVYSTPRTATERDNIMNYFNEEYGLAT